MKETTLKAIFVAAAGALWAYFSELIVPLAALTVVVVIDYLTGMGKAWVKGELCSKIGLKGAAKKVGYYVMVAVAMEIDFFIRYELTELGIAYEIDFMLSAMLIVWLAINECISILENLDAIGVPVPSWLMAVIKKLKTKTEEKAGVDEKKTEVELDGNT